MLDEAGSGPCLMLEQADNILIMDDQQQRSLDRGGAGRPIEHLIRPDIADELTFKRNWWTC